MPPTQSTANGQTVFGPTAGESLHNLQVTTQLNVYLKRIRESKAEGRKTATIKNKKTQDIQQLAKHIKLLWTIPGTRQKPTGFAAQVT